MKDRKTTISALVTKLARIQVMTPALPESLVARLQGQGKTAKEIISRVSTVNKRAAELMLLIENRLLQLKVPAKTIEKLVEEERRRLSTELINLELDALQTKHAGKGPKDIPAEDWQRMLALGHQLNELGKRKT